MFEQLIGELSQLEAVEAIALGGSRAGTGFDAKSDYDVYLYCNADIAQTIRHRILSRYCTAMELGNQFWELEDNCTLNNGIDIDILYRDLHSFESDIAQVVEQHQARNGYTTCMWHNLLNCKILYDPSGKLTRLQNRFRVPYPAQLKANIISRNCRLLYSALPAYRGQIAKAIRRRDAVSVHHRVTAFLESYFDILFALNEKTHPGEKRLVELCLKHCPLLPGHFCENLDSLFSHMSTAPEQINDDISQIIHQLQAILPQI